jgi:hypothetical protein
VDCKDYSGGMCGLNPQYTCDVLIDYEDCPKLQKPNLQGEVGGQEQGD